MSWKIVKEGDGYVVTWGGEPWGMEPRPLPWCEGYVERLQERYPDGGAWLVQEPAPGRTRGGPWRYYLPDGTSRVIEVSRLADAKAVLRHERQVKRLPRGIRWEIEP